MGGEDRGWRAMEDGRREDRRRRRKEDGRRRRKRGEIRGGKENTQSGEMREERKERKERTERRWEEREEKAQSALCEGTPGLSGGRRRIQAECEHGVV
eukprot:2251273-Rhodomonas_salina.1